ncbi:MAG: site-specific DNA-methyltransferase, partial [Planctomycetes bacterium]|nr:site-specific DNA-methyltransferase [Planctomycetota bacterium]
AGVRLRKPPVFKRNGVPGSGGPDWLRNDYEFVVCASNGRLPWSANTAMGRPPKYQSGGSASNRQKDGSRKRAAKYAKPMVSNPGNVVECKVGGGLMGDRLCHENEAPFPEALAAFFVRSFCPPGGVVLDPFTGSGTTAAVAWRWSRRAIGIDVRGSQIGLTTRRLLAAQDNLQRDTLFSMLPLVKWPASAFDRAAARQDAPMP